MNDSDPAQVEQEATLSEPQAPGTTQETHATPDTPPADEPGATVAAETDAEALVEATVEPPAEEAPVDVPLEAWTGGDEYDDDDDDDVERDETGYPAMPEEDPRPVFADLGLSEPVLRGIADMGYRHPTPIQEQAIPVVLMTRDVMGVAQTGTGKTASFTLPMMDILSGSRARARMPRSLILEPTRELALQVAENFVQYGKYMKLTHALIIGGESMSDQKDVLNKGVDVLIATPGRLIDMFDRGTILLTDTRILVIDEADRMLDMGFIPDVERIVSLLPKTRQTLFFSATMGPEIKRLADAFLQNPKEITVSKPATVASTITEGLALVAEHDKREALRRLIRTQNVQNALIFCNRKRDVDILYKSLQRHKFDAGALHGDMAQSVRFQTLEKFKANELRLLVCSDVAARGIDIGGLSHVFNFDVPHHAEDYVHRIGRTGRAGLEGHAFTIAMPEDRLAVEAIEKLIGHPIPPLVVEGLDPVDWAEADGRRRRGRKTAASAAPARGRKARGDEAPKERAPRRAKAAATAAPEPVAEEILAVPEPARDPAPRMRAPREEPRRDEPRREEHRREEPRRDDTRRAEPRRDQAAPRDRYRRDNDLGPAVVGFGDDIPAFMLVRRRTAPAPMTETDA